MLPRARGLGEACGLSEPARVWANARGSPAPGGARGEAWPPAPPLADPVLLSDRDIRAHLDDGRLGLDPFDPAMVQPSSVDVRLDRYFRLFDNHKYPFIDPAEDQPELTRLIEVEPDEPFILHPGEFALGSTFERVTLPDDVAARLEGKSSLGPTGAAHALDGRVHRPGLLGSRHPRALERRDAPHQAVAGHEDRAGLLLPPVVAGGEPLWLRPVRQPLSGQRGPTASRSSLNFHRTDVGSTDAGALGG